MPDKLICTLANRKQLIAFHDTQRPLVFLLIFGLTLYRARLCVGVWEVLHGLPGFLVVGIRRVCIPANPVDNTLRIDPQEASGATEVRAVHVHFDGFQAYLWIIAACFMFCRISSLADATFIASYACRRGAVFDLVLVCAAMVTRVGNRHG